MEPFLLNLHPWEVTCPVALSTTTWLHFVAEEPLVPHLETNETGGIILSLGQIQWSTCHRAVGVNGGLFSIYIDWIVWRRAWCLVSVLIFHVIDCQIINLHSFTIYRLKIEIFLIFLMLYVNNVLKFLKK